MVPRTREQFVEAVTDLLAERLGSQAPFPGDWARMFGEIEGWAEMTDGHGDGECVARAEHDKAIEEAREEGRSDDLKTRTAELKQERDDALAEAKAAKAELERIKRLSPISATDVRAAALQAAADIRREAELIKTAKRLSKDGAAMRLGWAAEKLEKVSK